MLLEFPSTRLYAFQNINIIENVETFIDGFKRLYFVYRAV